MPSGLTRYQHSGQSHFVTFSCYHRLPFLDDPNWRDLVVVCLEQTRCHYSLRIFGYVVMPEHVHLLVSEPDIALPANAVQSLKIAVARRIRLQTHPNAPAFWQKRYYDHNIREYEAFVEKLQYIHWNPVKRSLCARPEDWPWSSYRHYATGEPVTVQIESEWTARLRVGEVPHLRRKCGAPSDRKFLRAQS